MRSKLMSKWNNMHDAAKSAIAFAVSSLTIKGISFLVTPIFTRIMSTSEFGVVTAYNAWDSILEVFALLGLTYAGIFNTGLNDHKEDRNHFIANTLLLCNVITVIVFLLIVVAKHIIGDSFILPTKYLLIMFIVYLFRPAQIFWITRERYEYKYKLATIIAISSSLLSQIVAILFVKSSLFDSLAFSKVLGTALGIFAFSIPIYCMLLKRGFTHIDLKIWKNMFFFSLPLIPHYLSQHVMASADRIMLSTITSTSAAAIYGVVSTISIIATVIWSSINGSLVPFTYDNLNNCNYKKVSRVVLPLVLAYSGLCVIVSLIGPEVIRILGPKEYYNGIYLIPPIVCVGFLNCLYNLYATVEFYHKKTMGIAVATIISCFVNLSLNYLLIPKFGYLGAAYTTLFSNLILILMHYMFYRKCQRERVYDDKLFIGITVICISLCELSMLLYSFIAIRYIIIVVILTILLINRNRIWKRILIVRNKA